MTQCWIRRSNAKEGDGDGDPKEGHYHLAFEPVEKHLTWLDFVVLAVSLMAYRIEAIL